MNAKEYLKEKFIKNDVKVRSVIPGVSTGYFKLADLLEEYHRLKSKEEAEERYKRAIRMLGNSELNGLTVYDRNKVGNMIRIASGKEES